MSSSTHFQSFPFLIFILIIWITIHYDLNPLSCKPLFFAGSHVKIRKTKIKLPNSFAKTRCFWSVNPHLENQANAWFSKCGFTDQKTPGFGEGLNNHECRLLVVKFDICTIHDMPEVRR